MMVSIFNIVMNGVNGKASNNYISSYATKNLTEDFAETFAEIMLDPSKVKRICPEKYKFFQEYVLKGI